MSKKNKITYIPILRNHNFTRQIGWAKICNKFVIRENARLEVGYKVISGEKETGKIIKNKRIELVEISLVNVKEPKSCLRKKKILTTR